MKRALLTALIAGLAAQLAFASGPAKVFRMELVETKSGEEPTEVKLRVPLSLVRAMAPKLQEALNDADFEAKGINFREVWQEVRDAGPNHYVEVKHEDGTFNVSTTETHLLIEADEENEGKVNIKVPLALGDLLFNLEQPIDVEEALDALSNMEGQDLIVITGDHINMRAWIESAE